jgi:dihydrofolate reductase
MNDQRRIIVYIATSADGFIARSDGSVDWLSRPRTAGDHGMSEFYKTIDAIIWGRATFDQAVQRFGGKVEKLADPRAKIKNYVISHRPGPSLPGLEFVNEPLDEFAARLRAQPGKNVWIMGGGGIIGSLLDVGGVDEFIIHVIPTFIGEGIPLIAPGSRTVELELVDTKAWKDGVTKLHYKVLPATTSKPTPVKKAKPKSKKRN